MRETKEAADAMTAINRWILSYRNRCANIWYNQDYTVYGLNPAAGGQTPGDANIVTLHDLGNGIIALQCGGDHNAFASMRDDYGYRVQFQAPYSAGWITQPAGDEFFQAIPTGDGYFALYSPHFGRYVAIDPSPNPKAGNCNPLAGSAGDIDQAARFTATGLDHNSVLDFVQVGKNASGLSFAGLNLANVDLSHNNLSLCDFREATSLSSCKMNGANLRQAEFAGLHLGGLQISGADCRGADFTGCDFTSFTPGTPPPVLAQARLIRAVLPAGISWSGANMPGVVLAEANLTGCDLSSTATNLAGANFSGADVTVFTPACQHSGIGPYDLRSPADRIIAYDYDGTGHLDHLVCYRPRGGAIGIFKRNGASYDPVYKVYDSPRGGIGGYTLSDPADRIIAYDYNGTGHLDHLVCYRPGTGTIAIIEKQLDGDNVKFAKVYDSPRGGIGGYTLSDPADRIIAYDYNGTGHLDHLVCYRPGTGTIAIIENRAAGPATLAGCNLSHANLPAASLAGLDLTTTTLAGANLAGTNLAAAKLAGADLTGTSLVGTNFAGTDLTTVRFPSPLTRSTDPKNPTSFASCTLPYAVIGLDWSWLDLTSTTIAGLPSDLTGLVATGVRRPSGDFEGRTLDSANFASATLDGAVFSRARLRSASFAGARLTGTVFTRAVLDQVIFVGSALGGVQLSQAANFSFAFLSNCDFTQANLYGVIFAGATLVSGNKLQTGTNLQETDFSDAYLPNADFTGASMQGAKFDGAFMVECVLTNADLSPARQGAIPASLASACLQAASLQGTKLAGANLAEAAITGTAGKIMQQYYGEDGKLTPMFPMRYPGRNLPDAASFSNQTTCPNTLTYGTNVAQGRTIEQMMEALHPPTQWTPRDTQQATDTHPRSSSPPERTRGSRKRHVRQ
jgi:uncharacterized protein YjbI with pentapeptide repeats